MVRMVSGQPPAGLKSGHQFCPEMRLLARWVGVSAISSAPLISSSSLSPLADIAGISQHQMIEYDWNQLSIRNWWALTRFLRKRAWRVLLCVLLFKFRRGDRCGAADGQEQLGVHHPADGVAQSAAGRQLRRHQTVQRVPPRPRPVPQQVRPSGPPHTGQHPLYLPTRSIHLFIHQSIHPSIHPSIHLSIYLSIQSVTQSASHSFNQRNVAAIFGRYYLVFWETCRRRANPPARCQLAHESADQRCRFFIPPHLKWLNQRKMRRKLTKTKTETKK